MTLKEIAAIRLINQKVAKTELTSAKEIVSWMGAMQAQDYSMAKLAVGIRMLNPKEVAVEKALNEGEILRTHILRPTWHFVSAEDIGWMLELTAPHVKSSLRSRQKSLELTDAVHLKSKKLIEKAFSDGINLTREDLAKEFGKAKIKTDENRLSHLLLIAELDGQICSGPFKDRKQTYTLLRDRIQIKRVFTRDESLAELAKRYFRSHGPATIDDFKWWSGLPVKDAGRALGFVKSEFISEKVDSKEYWFMDSVTGINSLETATHLLPAYDEFLISYKDRSPSLTLTDNKKVISDNGIFRPVIVINGQVAGLWKSSVKNKEKNIEIQFLQPQGRIMKKVTEEVAGTIGDFYGVATRINFID